MPQKILRRAILWSLGLMAGLGAAEVNIAPDAVTSATQGYNYYEGDLSFLTDGLYPGNSDRPGAFIWPTKGNLVFQFAEPRQVSSLRIYVGDDAGIYTVLAYRGARLGESGQTETGNAELVADAFNADLQVNAWVELPLPPGTLTDYIELGTQSSAKFYEVEILSWVAEPTQVSASSWGAIKGLRR